MNGKRHLLLLSILYMAMSPALAQEPDITLHSTVSGNQQQPKVMYILPWQPPSDRYIEQEFSSDLQGGLFVALDREEFVRELNYRATMNAATDTSESESIATLLNTQ